ncbi:hypothetical protein FNV43_RR04294 [Rhamnella rubrinervis]|uniref:Uncharacterized protein n=1 Tax=Rhamnella rubrinervis TaxID=2594499 RepID=A0A8K0HLM6_9ROSA|nr:hypothetical protein FNV43_RR04294 [Rhamnella rubrinervis]
MGQLVSTFLCVSLKQSYDLMEEPNYKRPRLSSELTFFQSDIVVELHQAEVKTDSSSIKSRQCPGKGVMVQGEPSHRMAATTPASFSEVECKEIRAFEESLDQELERKKFDVAKFLSGFTAVPLPNEQHQNDPGEQEALNDHLDHIDVVIPCVVEVSFEEEYPEEEEDPEKEEDSEEEEDPEEFLADI